MLDDRITVDTPEGVTLELTLAGLGTRIVAAMLDALIQGVLTAVVLFGLIAAGSDLGADAGFLLLGIVSIVVTIVLVGYPIAFETLNGGKTPGKSALGIRVISSTGAPVGFWPSTIRNLFRLVDFLPTGYAAGAFAILASERNQRLGDMAAATIVVRDRARRQAIARPPVMGEGAGWDVSAVSRDEVALLRRFFDRSRSLTADRREQLAAQIAGRLRSKVGGADQALSNEEFLRRTLEEKLRR